MHFLKEGQKIRAWVDPPLHHSGNARKKTFFSIDVFPNYCKGFRRFLKPCQPLQQCYIYILGLWLTSSLPLNNYFYFFVPWNDDGCFNNHLLWSEADWCSWQSLRAWAGSLHISTASTNFSLSSPVSRLHLHKACHLMYQSNALLPP